MPGPLNHPVYSRKKCPGCPAYMTGIVVPPIAEGAKTVVVYLCDQCDRPPAA